MRIQGVGNHSHLLLVRKTLISFSKAICKRLQEPLKSFCFLQGSSLYPLFLLHQLIHLKPKSIIYLLMAPKRDTCACFGLVWFVHSFFVWFLCSSTVLAWRIPGTAEPGGLPSLWGLTESDTTEVTQQQHLDGIIWYLSLSV